MIAIPINAAGQEDATNLLIDLEVSGMDWTKLFSLARCLKN